MPLPTTTTTLHHTDTYPDRVRVVLAYRTSGIRRHTDFARVLRPHGFRGTDHLLRCRLTVLGINHPVNITAWFDRYRFTASFRVDLNALRELHDVGATYNEIVRPYLDPDHRDDGEINWLHPDQVTPNIHDVVVNRLWEMVLAVMEQLVEPSCALICSDHLVFDGGSRMRLELAETAVDLATMDSHFTLRRIGSAFKRQFDHVIATRFGPSGRGRADVQADGNMLQGFRLNSDKCKGYEKTDRRLRLERSIYEPALSNCLTSAAFEDEEGFRHLFRTLAEQAVVQFNTVLQQDHPAYDHHGSLAELISLVNPILRRHQPTEVQRVYNSLIRHGRLTTQVLSSAALGRLSSSDVLVNSARGSGIYEIHPRYALALRSLRVADGRWQGQ